MNIFFLFDIKYLLFWINIGMSYYAYNNNFYCKNKIDRIYYSLMWILLKLYSKIEIIYNKIKKTDIKKITIKVIKNGEVIKTYNNDKLKNNDLDKNDIPNDNDMILGEYNDNEYIKVVRYKSKENIILNSDNYTNSNVKLIGIQIKIFNNNNLKDTEPILFDKNYNYFIENNILFDRKFINYYLKTEKKPMLNSDDKYQILFFDNDINTHTINDPQYIKINKENFEIIEDSDNYEIINTMDDNNIKINNSENFKIFNMIKSINWIGPIYAGQEDY